MSAAGEGRSSLRRPHTQPAHLQKLRGKELDGEERNAERARYLRSKLREAGAHPN